MGWSIASHGRGVGVIALLAEGKGVGCSTARGVGWSIASRGEVSGVEHC